MSSEASDTREQVLANIRRSLNRSGALPQSVTGALNARLRQPARNPSPGVGENLVARFIAEVAAVNGEVIEVERTEDAAEVVLAHLERYQLPEALVVAPDPELAAIPWSNRLRVERRAAIGSDRVSVTSCFAGIAETGTVVMLSGPDNPTTLNFLPDDHLVVLKRSRIVAQQEDVWPLLRAAEPEMPRTVNLITGPSKTGDVELIIQEGAHGPRRLRVILVAGG